MASYRSDGRVRPGLDFFWEQADSDGSGEHPLERELCDRLDALVRYRRLIEEASTGGRDGALEHLLRQHEREEHQVEALRDALRRLKARRSGG